MNAAQLPKGVKVFQDISYVTSGSLSQKLDLYLPTDAVLPALVIMVHGGAWIGGSKEDEDVGKFLKAGYAVASIDYRLSGEALFPAQLYDCKAAVRWLRAHADEFGYDPRRFGAYGESAGGHLVSLLGTTSDIRTFDMGESLNMSSKVDAVVDYFGPTDFLQRDDQDAHVLDDPDTPEALLIGGTIRQNKEKVAQANPITYISAATCPFFIAHGDVDSAVPYKQSVIFEEALRKAGIPVALRILHGFDHCFQDEETEAMALAFFEKYLASPR